VRFAANIESAVKHRQILSPVDPGRTYGLTGGNIFQGSKSQHQLFSMRPIPSWSGHRTSMDGLCLCGSVVHLGDGVMGAGGRKAAMAMIHT